MMVEGALDAPQDYGGMSTTGLPQWKRELLQRRAARCSLPPAPRAPPPAPPPPPPPPAPPLPPDEDEELRYGPGIVKKLKSRYLSLALRDAPRRRPSVLRRAASLEHLLEHPPPPPSPSPAPSPAPAPSPRQPPARALLLSRPAVAARRESIKRARSVDALSRLERLDSREDEPRPAPRAPRPPRRPTPLLRDSERPPPDVVRSALRKFECATPRRTAPAARISGVLRGLARTPPPPPRSTAVSTQTTPSLRTRPPPPPRASSPLCSTPEPRTRTPSPAAVDLSVIRGPIRDEVDEVSPSKVVSQAALEGIARAGASVRYSFECTESGSHLPSLAAANPVVLGRVRLTPSPRQVGVIRPMPAPTRDPSPPPPAAAPPDLVKRPLENGFAEEEPIIVPVITPAPEPVELIVITPPPPSEVPKIKSEEIFETERVRISPPRVNGEIPKPTAVPVVAAVTLRKSGPRVPPPAATTIVFNFSNRKEVPDYVENDGLILKASRKDRLKAGDAGVVLLRKPAGSSDSDSDEESAAERLALAAGPPSPCDVRFVNDNILINGRSNLVSDQRDPTRIAKLKLQFDDSLTRTFEYPSESSLNDDTSPQAPGASLAANTHLAGGPLSSYQPCKMLMAPAAFQLGVTRATSPPPPAPAPSPATNSGGVTTEDGWAAEDYLKPCGEAEGRAWSESRHTDLLF